MSESVLEKPATAAERTVVVKNLEHMQAKQALDRFLADVFEGNKGLEELVEQVGGKSLADSLRSLAFAPVCRPITLNLKEKLTQTREGERLFELAENLYGLFGREALPVSKIAVKLKLSHLECKRSIIRLKARLATTFVRSLVEEALKEQAEAFARSALAQVMAMNRHSERHLFVQENSENSENLENFSAPSENRPGDESQSELSQFDLVVRALAQENKLNIEGPSGSGKTNLAVQLACHLAEQGKSVLYICHSRLLASYVREKVEPLKLAVNPLTFHGMCHASAMAAGLKVPRFVSERVFTELFPELLVEAMHLRPELKFDALIVDEGHALTSSMRRALKACLKDREGPFIFFYDAQLLSFNRKAQPPRAQEIILPARRPLIERQEAVELFEAITEKEKHDTVSLLVEKLICEDGYCPRDIAILSSRSKGRLRFNLPSEIRIVGKPRADQNKNTLVATSIFKFRSLTAPVVILIDLDEEVEEMTAWKLKYFSYLAYGRARDKLILVGSQSAMQKLLPQDITTIATADFA